MLLLLQILFSLIVTLFYAFRYPISLNVLSILSIPLVFLIAFIAFLILILVIGLPLIYATEKLDTKNWFKHQLINTLGAYIFVDLFRVRLVVTGQENLPKNNLFVLFSNHIEYTDPIYLKIVFKKYPMAYVAKDPLFKVILVKNILRGIGCVPITKNADRSAMKSIIDSIKVVKSGQPMGIFPEGMRTYSNRVIDFKPGAFKLATKSNADIVPICLYNMHGILKKGRIRTHTSYIHICPAIPYETYKDTDTLALAEQVKTIVESKLKEFKQRIPEDCEYNDLT